MRYGRLTHFSFSVALGASCHPSTAEAQAPAIAQVSILGDPGQQTSVRAVVVDDDGVLLAGQRERSAAHPGDGFLCRFDPVAGACSAAEEDVIPGSTSGGMARFTEGWSLAVEGDDVYLTGKTLDGGAALGCPANAGGTDAWLQRRDRNDPAHLMACSVPGLDGPDEGLAIEIVDDYVFWGGTRWSPSGGNQVAVLHRQSRGLEPSPTLSRHLPGGALAELFDITHTDELILVTGRTDDDYTTTAFCAAAAVGCFGSKGPKTDTFIAAFDFDLNLQWLWQDASAHKSAGQSIAVVDDGAGRRGVVVAGHHHERDAAAPRGVRTCPGGERFTDAMLVWLELDAAGAPTGRRRVQLFGQPCSGESFTGMAVDGTRIFAVGAVGGPPSVCGPTDGHCPPTGDEDALLTEYAIDPATGALSLVSSRVFSGTAGDDTDAFLEVAYDADADRLYLGGTTRSAEFEGEPVVGPQDGVIVTVDP